MLQAPASHVHFFLSLFEAAARQIQPIRRPNSLRSLRYRPPPTLCKTQGYGHRLRQLYKLPLTELLARKTQHSPDAGDLTPVHPGDDFRPVDPGAGFHDFVFSIDVHIASSISRVRARESTRRQLYNRIDTSTPSLCWPKSTADRPSSRFQTTSEVKTP